MGGGRHEGPPRSPSLAVERALPDGWLLSFRWLKGHAKGVKCSEILCTLKEDAIFGVKKLTWLQFGEELEFHLPIS